MKNTDQIIEAAEAIAKNRTKKLPMVQRQREFGIIRDAYIAGYSEALRDARNHVFAG